MSENKSRKTPGSEIKDFTIYCLVNSISSMIVPVPLDLKFLGWSGEWRGRMRGPE